MSVKTLKQLFLFFLKIKMSLSLWNWNMGYVYKQLLLWSCFQPCPDVFWFPIVTETFAKHLVEVKWTWGTIAWTEINLFKFTVRATFWTISLENSHCLLFFSLRKQPTFGDVTTGFPPNDVWETSAEIPYWWHVTTQILACEAQTHFRSSRERSDDRKYVCASQATQIWVVLLLGRAAWEIWFNQVPLIVQLPLIGFINVTVLLNCLR